jgi:predicted metal-dependent hydrolase
VTRPGIDMHHFVEGIRLFNQARFFDAHEAWEDVWRSSAPADKKFFQGLTQLAVAFHHHSTGNIVGACSVMHRGLGNLADSPAEHGIYLRRLCLEVSQWLLALERGHPLPDHPRVHESSRPLPHHPRVQKTSD